MVRGVMAPRSNGRTVQSRLGLDLESTRESVGPCRADPWARLDTTVFIQLRVRSCDARCGLYERDARPIWFAPQRSQRDHHGAALPRCAAARVAASPSLRCHPHERLDAMGLSREWLRGRGRRLAARADRYRRRCTRARGESPVLAR
jgi:hypothetical protein